jgi:three-Cys-motif partner protein
MPLPDYHPEKWVYREHTRVKHELLRKYLKPWIYHLGKNRKICYFDGFAGRGEYEGGFPGSPLIAIQVADECCNHFDEFVCINIEKNAINFKNLEEVINRERGKYSEKIKIYNFEGEFADVVSGIINKVGARLVPSFFFIDPFGFKGVPFELIKDILSIEKTEVFINFMYHDINRFLTSPNHEEALNELFGTDKWKDILRMSRSEEREHALRDLYRTQLHEVAGVKYSWAFRVSIPEIRRTMYYLIFATNHFKGLQIMKDIMYNQGPEGMFAYLGRDQSLYAPEQTKLFESDEIAEFKEYLLKRFGGRRLSYYCVKEESYMETKFIDKHYREALKELENDNRIQIQRNPPITSIGRPRRGLNNNDIIVFP